MEKAGYIINLSTRFNARNYLYYFFPSISSEKILHFRLLAEQQLPTFSKTQEAEIKKRIWELKNHWHLYKLNPKNSASKLRLNLVLDYNNWEFLQCGEYGRFPFAKLKFIHNLLDTYFSKEERNSMFLQYFFLNKKGDDLEENIREIDNQKGLQSNDKTHPIWFTYNDLDVFLQKKYSLNNKNIEDVIDSDIKSIYEDDVNKLLQTLTQKITNQELNENFKAIISVFLEGLKKQLLSQVNYNKDLSSVAHKKKLCYDYFQHFSAESYLKPAKDLLFRVHIDDANNKKKINSYEKLAVLLVESIETYGQTDPISFWSQKGNLQTLHLKDIVFSEEKRTSLFNFYKSVAESFENNTENDIEDKKLVKQFAFNEELNPDSFYEYNEEEENNFISIRNLEQSIPFFYSVEAYRALKKRLSSNSFSVIEDKIKTQSFEIGKKMQLEGDYGLGEKTTEMTAKEVIFYLEKLQKEEMQTSLASNVNEEGFRRKKEEVEMATAKLHNSFLHQLRMLSIVSDIGKFLVLFAVLSLLFTMPLYSFNYPIQAFIFTGAILLISGIVALGATLLFRSQIINKFNAIKLKNISLSIAFKEYITSLKELAKEVRKSTLRRKNISELKKVHQQFLDEENKRSLYQKFYKDLILQLEKNGYKTYSQSNILPANYNCSPYYDYRMQKQEKVNHLQIKLGNASSPIYTIEDDLKSTLNIIKTIEFE